MRIFSLALAAFLCFALTTTPSLDAQTELDPKLPADSKKLVERLSEWEEERKAEYAMLLNEKRTEVIGILNSQMDDATRRGQLDSALAIRTTIESIQALDGSLEDSKEEAVTEVVPKKRPTRRVRIPRDAVEIGGVYFKKIGRHNQEEARAAAEELGANLLTATFGGMDVIAERFGEVEYWLDGMVGEGGTLVWGDGTVVEDADWAHPPDGCIGQGVSLHARKGKPMPSKSSRDLPTIIFWIKERR